MKIIDIKSHVLQYKLPEHLRFSYSQGWYDSRTIMILEVITDEGIIGWGESLGPAFIHKKIIEEVYKPLILGKDPFDNEIIWETLYSSLQDHGQKGVVIEAISAIDIALWDIKGKYTGLPIYKLLGGAFRDKLLAYATGFYRRNIENEVEELVNEAHRYIDDGFKALKIKIGFGIDEDIKTVKAIREAIGDEIIMMVDANHAYNASNAIKVGKRLEEFDIFWFEEPVPPEDKNGYIEVKNNINIPIAGGEAEFTRYGIKDLINKRCINIIQPDTCAVGGITEFKKIVSLATINNIQCYPHIWGSSIALAAGTHIGFSLPNFPNCLYPPDVMLELDQTPNIFRNELSSSPIIFDDGIIKKNNKPGLGININKALIEKYEII